MPNLRTTHTYAILGLSNDAYDEIRRKLKDSGYSQNFHFQDGRELIEMHGLAIEREQNAEVS